MNTDTNPGSLKPRRHKGRRIVRAFRRLFRHHHKSSDSSTLKEPSLQLPAHPVASTIPDRTGFISILTPEEEEVSEQSLLIESSLVENPYSESNNKLSAKIQQEEEQTEIISVIDTPTTADKSTPQFSILQVIYSSILPATSCLRVLPWSANNLTSSFEPTEKYSSDSFSSSISDCVKNQKKLRFSQPFQFSMVTNATPGSTNVPNDLLCVAASPAKTVHTSTSSNRSAVTATAINAVLDYQKPATTATPTTEGSTAIDMENNYKYVDGTLTAIKRHKEALPVIPATCKLVDSAHMYYIDALYFCLSYIC